jgi:hypothetical protein
MGRDDGSSMAGASVGHGGTKGGRRWSRGEDGMTPMADRRGTSTWCRKEGLTLAVVADWGREPDPQGSSELGARWGGVFSRLDPGVAADWGEPGRAREVGWGQGAEQREARGEVVR